MGKGASAEKPVRVAPGKIVVAGYAIVGGQPDVLLARYDPGSFCGDGVVDVGEECDDGNAADRDGCSSSCVVDVDCPVPASGCFELTRSGTPLLLIKDKSPDQKDSLKWVWNKGQCTLPEDFGDPTGSTSMEVELLREGSPVFSTTIARGGTCGPKNKDCWKAVKGGYKYVDPSATTGVKSLLLKSGAEGKSKIILVAKGESVQPPTLPVTGPVTARLTTSTGTCFEARYADFVKNESELLKAFSE